MTLRVQIIPVTAFRQNCCILWDDESKEAVITDMGGDADVVWQEIAKNGLKAKEIWLTHGHLDHAGGVVSLHALCRLPVLGPHQDDAFLLDGLPQITQQYGFPVSPAFKPDRWLNNDEVLSVGRFSFQVIHIPGHTPGHVVFYCEEAKLLIAGDVLFYESIGRTDFPRSNHDDLIHHIRHRLYTLPDDTVVISGHGRSTTIGHEKRHNPFIQA